MKKIKLQTGRYEFSPLKKLLLMAKLTTLLILISFMQISAKVYSQAGKLDLKVKNVSILQVFEEIEDNSQYRFFYDNEQVDLTKNVSIDTKQEEISTILKELFDGTDLTYQVKDYLILVQSKNSNVKTIFSNQQKNVTGTVTDETEQPLPGVTVLIKGTTNGTVTNMEGNYNIADIPNGSTLVFSFVGMITQEITVENQTTIDVTMKNDAIGIEEVVAIGYGTMKKANVTNAIAKINSEALEERPLTSLSEAFSGQIAGVYAQQASGLPGKEFDIKIRGTNSITSGSGPLFVVDGMPVSDMTDFNLNDVASVEVLKDASAAAIYGARGAGGIVLITTKTGKPGDTKIDFDAYTGVQSVSEKIPMMNADQWIDYTQWFFKEKYRRDGKGNPFTDPSITEQIMGSKYWTRQFWYNDETKKIMTDTDWQDEGLQPAQKSNYQITLTKGLENGSFLVSGNYLDQDGLFEGTSFKRYNLRSNARYDINEKIQVGMNLSASHSEADGYTNGEGKESPYMRLIVADPTVPVDMNVRSTQYGLLSNDPNPIIQSERITDLTKTTRNIGDIYANYQIIQGLTLGGKYGLDIRNEEYTYFKPQDVNKKERREGAVSNRNGLRSLIQGTINFDKTFNLHTVGLMLGSSYEKSHTKTVSLDSWNFASDDIHTFNTAATFNGWNDYETEWSLLSYFGRAIYNYYDRYILSASIRRDGSSRFGEDTKFGIFPSASAAWRINNENFFKNISFISDLKIRLSWGKTGNDNIGNYSSYGRLANYNYAYSGKLVYGFAPSSPDNPTLTWETNTTTDVGLDLGFLGNRITLTADYYINKTTDLLLDVPAPAITGFPGSITLNSGSLENKGWEFEVTSINVQSTALGGIKWKTSLNLSHNKNEVTSLGYGIQQLIGEMSNVPTHITKVGLPIRSFYLYDYIGVLSEEDIANNKVAKFNQQEAGNEKIRDVNGDGKITEDDRTVVGSNHPKLIFGIMNRFQIGNFDLNILINGVTGFDTYFFFGRYIDGGQEANRNKMENWVNGYRNASQPGDGKTPYPFGVNPEFSDRWLYNGDYYRIKNLTFGYTVPSSVLSTIKIRSLRAYVSIDNLLNITDYPGGNPETNSFTLGNAYAQGADYGTFPLTRTFIFGVKVGF